MQARTLKIIAALLIISAVFMGIIGYKISQQEIRRVEQQPVASAPSSSDYVYAEKVLITTRAFNKGEVISEEDVQLTPFPIVVEGSIKKLSDIAGQPLENGVAKGAVLRESYFEKQSTLAPLINPGNRALAVKVDEVIGSGGFLKPGDYVDVIFTAKASKETYDKSLSRRILRNVKVLAYGETVESDVTEAVDPKDKNSRASADKDSGKRSRSAVLEVTQSEVNKLILAEDRGELRLAVVGEADMAALIEGDESALPDGQEDDDATFIRAVTGLTPPPPPKRVYVYNGDKVETITVPK